MAKAHTKYTGPPPTRARFTGGPLDGTDVARHDAGPRLQMPVPRSMDSVWYCRTGLSTEGGVTTALYEPETSPA